MIDVTAVYEVERGRRLRVWFGVNKVEAVYVSSWRYQQNPHTLQFELTLWLSGKGLIVRQPEIADDGATVTFRGQVPQAASIAWLGEPPTETPNAEATPAETRWTTEPPGVRVAVWLETNTGTLWVNTFPGQDTAEGCVRTVPKWELTHFAHFLRIRLHRNRSALELRHPTRLDGMDHPTWKGEAHLVQGSFEDFFRWATAEQAAWTPPAAESAPKAAPPPACACESCLLEAAQQRIRELERDQKPLRVALERLECDIRVLTDHKQRLQADNARLLKQLKESVSCDGQVFAPGCRVRFEDGDTVYRLVSLSWTGYGRCMAKVSRRSDTALAILDVPLSRLRLVPEPESPFEPNRP